MSAQWPREVHRPEPLTIAGTFMDVFFDWTVAVTATATAVVTIIVVDRIACVPGVDAVKDSPFALPFRELFRWIRSSSHEESSLLVVS